MIVEIKGHNQYVVKLEDMGRLYTLPSSTFVQLGEEVALADRQPFTYTPVDRFDQYEPGGHVGNPQNSLNYQPLSNTPDSSPAVTTENSEAEIPTMVTADTAAETN